MLKEIYLFFIKIFMSKWKLNKGGLEMASVICIMVIISMHDKWVMLCQKACANCVCASWAWEAVNVWLKRATLVEAAFQNKKALQAQQDLKIQNNGVFF